MPYLDKLGFNLVGYGCTTCIGNSGPLPDEVSAAVNDARPDRRLGAVGQPELRGPDQPRRQDELPRVAAACRGVRARRHDGSGPHHRAAGRRRRRQSGDAVATSGRPARDPGRRSTSRCYARRSRASTPTCSPVTNAGRRCPTPTGDIFEWDDASTYVRKPPYFDGMRQQPLPVTDITGRECWRCSATRSRPTTSRRPAPSRPTARPGSYLTEHGVDRTDFNSYGSRRGNHEVMIRGTFANIRLRNQMVPGCRGRLHRNLLTGEQIADLRRRGALPAGRRPAGHPGRQGVRLRFVARLGREGHRAARRTCGHRGELRAHPPLQPDRHGRVAAAVPGRPERRDAGPDRRRRVHHQRHHGTQRRTDADRPCT